MRRCTLSILPSLMLELQSHLTRVEADGFVSEHACSGRAINRVRQYLDARYFTLHRQSLNVGECEYEYIASPTLAANRSIDDRSRG